MAGTGWRLVQTIDGEAFGEWRWTEVIGHFSLKGFKRYIHIANRYPFILIRMELWPLRWRLFCWMKANARSRWSGIFLWIFLETSVFYWHFKISLVDYLIHFSFKTIVGFVVQLTNIGLIKSDLSSNLSNFTTIPH